MDNPLYAGEQVCLLQQAGKRLSGEITVSKANLNREILRLMKKQQSGEAPSTLVIDASRPFWLNGNQHRGVLLTGLKNRRTASRVKRIAWKLYPSGYRVMVKNGPPRKEYFFWKPLEEIGSLKNYHAGTCAYFPPAGFRTLAELEEIMQKLRSREGCPWDIRQDHRSLRPYLIEEAYEVIEAIERNDRDLLKEELGDLLLQVIFHAQIASEKDKFSLSDVLEGINTKIIRRHPHVFGGHRTSSVQEVLKKWEEIKKDEPGNSSQKAPSKDAHLPSLVRALKTQQRASKLGFDWETENGVVDKLKEELEEFISAYHAGSGETIEEELGDFLFSVVNFSRFVGVNPEICLGKAVNKFEQRFAYVEEKVYETGRDFEHYNMEELDEWWEEAKKFVEKRNK